MEKHRIKILDLNKPLLREKAKGRAPLYWATDSHWNSFGAYVAYSEIIKKYVKEQQDSQIRAEQM